MLLSYFMLCSMCGGRFRSTKEWLSHPCTPTPVIKPKEDPKKKPNAGDMPYEGEYVGE